MSELLQEKIDILVVDDDHSMRFLTTQSLNADVFHVYEATCAQEALSILEHLRPALMIMDVCMPDVDGFELCASIRQQPALQDIPILMITGLYDTDSIQHAFESGATDFIAKPVNWGLLPHRVQFLIRSSKAIETAKQNASRLTRAQEIAHLGWFEWDVQQQHIEVSDEICHIFQTSTAKQRNFFETLMTYGHPEDQCRFRMEIQEVLHGSKSLNIEYRIQISPSICKTIHLHGEPDLNAQGSVCFIRGTIQDISARAESEATIRRLAYYDQVTGLPNRGLYKEHLRTALAHAQRDGHQVAVMFLDLDKFKRINDTLGHKAGDILLAQVAEVLTQCIRDTDILARIETNNHEVARLGGDEFTLMLTHIHHNHEAALVAKRIVHALQQPFTLSLDDEQHEVVISSSIGIALYPDDAADAKGLLTKADIAMYRVKNQGRNAYCFFDSSMQQPGKEHFALEAEFRYALQHDELELHYQPKVQSQTGKIVGLEALVRWNHPTQGLIAPYKFIPLAEELGLMVTMGSLVLLEACQQYVAWQAQGVPVVPIAINLSGQQFSNRCLFTEVKEVLAQTGMDPYALELEITETVLMKNAERTMKTLNQLKDIGISLAVDDFGTGYSSMSYLKYFPIDVLKIDGSFIRETPNNKQDCGIAEAIVSLGNGLGLQTIAECVETPEQLEFLQHIGCNQIQGYLFSPPRNAADTQKSLVQGHLKPETPQLSQTVHT